MKQKTNPARLLLLTVLPALLLLAGSGYQKLTELLRLPPYLTFCLAGLFVLSGCLIWGSSLCASMLRPASRTAALLLTAFTALCALLYLLSGLRGAAPAVAPEKTVMAALPPFFPVLLFHILNSPRAMRGRRLFGAAAWLLLFSGILVSALMLTDPLHHLVFPVGGSEAGPGMTLLLSYTAAGVLGAQLWLLITQDAPRRAAILFSVFLAVETAVFLCLSPLAAEASPLLSAFFAPLPLFFSCALAQRLGLLPDGGCYPELLRISALPIQLMDSEGTILFGADSATPVTASQTSAILTGRQSSVLLQDRSFRLDSAPIRGGFVLQQTDLHDLRTLQDALEEATRALDDARARISCRAELESRLAHQEEQREFFREQTGKMQERTVQLSVFLRAAASPDMTQDARHAVIVRANVLVTYVRELSLLLASEAAELPVSALIQSLEASAQAVSAASFRCRVFHVAQGSFPLPTLLALYGFAEQIMERQLFLGIPELDFRLRNEKSGLRLTAVLPERFGAALSPFADSLAAEAARLGGEAVLQTGSGSASVRIDLRTGGVCHA